MSENLDLYQRMEQGAAVLQLIRPLTRRHYARLEQRVASLFANGASAVILDLHAVEFADSTGISLLLAAHKTAPAANKRLYLCNVSKYFSNIIDTLNLSDVFWVRSTVEQALRETGGDS